MVSVTSGFSTNNVFFLGQVYSKNSKLTNKNNDMFGN